MILSLWSAHLNERSGEAGAKGSASTGQIRGVPQGCKDELRHIHPYHRHAFSTLPKEDAAPGISFFSLTRAIIAGLTDFFFF